MKDDETERPVGRPWLETVRPRRQEVTLADAEATVDRCQREHDRWTGWMNRSSNGMLFCFCAITALVPLRAPIAVPSVLALSGIILWIVESMSFREAVGWMYWLEKAKRELRKHPDFKGSSWGDGA